VLSFRWTTWKIKYLVKAARIAERLRKAGMSKCIRSVNCERLLSLGYEND
jgi:hypothetical protein